MWFEDKDKDLSLQDEDKDKDLKIGPRGQGLFSRTTTLKRYSVHIDVEETTTTTIGIQSIHVLSVQLKMSFQHSGTACPRW